MDAAMNQRFGRTSKHKRVPLSTCVNRGTSPIRKRTCVDGARELGFCHPIALRIPHLCGAPHVSFVCHVNYRGTSLIRNAPLLGPYSRTIPRVAWWSYGGGLFLMSEVPPCAGYVDYRAWIPLGSS